MFTVYATYPEHDNATATITVFDSVITDADALRDLYAALDGDMDCETCCRTVLTMTTVEYDGRAITAFSPFGVDVDDSGTVLCVSCIVQGASLGHSVLSNGEGYDVPAAS